MYLLLRRIEFLRIATLALCLAAVVEMPLVAHADDGAGVSLWSLIDRPGPRARSQFGFAYDSDRELFVVMGGTDNITTQQATFEDTWTWDGVEWTEAGEGPGLRVGHAMAYDEGRQRIVLFGGLGPGFTALGDTWEWDGTTWLQVSAGGSQDPGARSTHAMAYDRSRGVTVLYGGGADGFFYNNVWEWDGSVWTERVVPAQESPEKRQFHALVYDDAERKTFLFGGLGEASGTLGDSWYWDGNDWTEVTATGPTPRYGHGLAYDSRRGVAVVFGGRNGAVLDETWEWDGASWTLVDVVPASQRYLHGMAYDSARDVIVMFGGRGIGPGLGFYDDTWEYSTSTSEVAISCCGPASCFGGSFVYIAEALLADGAGPGRLVVRASGEGVPESSPVLLDMPIEEGVEVDAVRGLNLPPALPSVCPTIVTLTATLEDGQGQEVASESCDIAFVELDSPEDE